MENFIDSGTRKSLEIIHNYCVDKEVRIAAAESVSAGLLQWMLASEKNSGRFFCGGITAYDCLEKGRHFAVPVGDCNPVLGVSREIAQQMAVYVCARFNCDLGLSLTGFASPFPEKGIFETYAYGSFVIDGKVKFTQRIAGTGFTTSEIQMEYGSKLLKSCANYLVENMMCHGR